MAAVRKNRWSVEYDAKLQRYSDLRDEVEFAISRSLQPLKVHSFSVRLKEKKSFLEKIRRKSYTEPFVQMPDIVGARIVVLFLDDLGSIEEILRDTFEVLNREDKTETVAPDTFSYRSVHYECRIKEEHSGPHYDDIKGILFEVQARTIVQDAWAAVEHTLAYKGDESIPDDLKRDISALVGLFHLVDRTFQQVKRDITQSEFKAKASITAAIKSGEQLASPPININRSTVKAFLHQQYPDREVNSDIEYSRFVNDLATFNVRRIGELRELLIGSPEAVKKALKEEKRLAPYYDYINEEVKENLSDVGFAKFVLDEVVPGFMEHRANDSQEIELDDED